MKNNNTCPKCGHTSDAAFEECPMCGVVVEKFLEKEKTRQRQKELKEAEKKLKEAEEKLQQAERKHFTARLRKKALIVVAALLVAPLIFLFGHGLVTGLLEESTLSKSGGDSGNDSGQSGDSYRMVKPNRSDEAGSVKIPAPLFQRLCDFPQDYKGKTVVVDRVILEGRFMRKCGAAYCLGVEAYGKMVFSFLSSDDELNFIVHPNLARQMVSWMVPANKKCLARIVARILYLDLDHHGCWVAAVDKVGFYGVNGDIINEMAAYNS